MPIGDVDPFKTKVASRHVFEGKYYEEKYQVDGFLIMVAKYDIYLQLVCECHPLRASLERLIWMRNMIGMHCQKRRI